MGNRNYGVWASRKFTLAIVKSAMASRKLRLFKSILFFALAVKYTLLSGMKLGGSFEVRHLGCNVTTHETNFNELSKRTCFMIT